MIGANDSGQLGIGSITAFSLEPIQIQWTWVESVNGRPTSVACGHDFACVITSKGHAW